MCNSLNSEVAAFAGTPRFAIGDEVLNGATDLKWLQAMIAEARRLSVIR
jgi:protein-disulfide isomerase